MLKDIPFDAEFHSLQNGLFSYDFCSYSLDIQITNVSSPTSFYSNPKRTNDDLFVTNGRMAKKTKLPPEVICLTDDDDNDDTNDKNSVATITLIEQEEPLTIVDSDTYEPANWTIHRNDIIHISELPSKYSDIFKKAFEIRCSAIRFGIVEFNVEDEVVLMNDNEFEMKLSGGFLENMNMKLAYSDVVTFYFSFQSQKPAAFIQVRSEFAELFNRYIPTSDERGRGFDPNSKDERRRRIVFCLKSLTPDMERIHISTIYHYLKSKCPKMDICCVTASRAQELYNLARFARVTPSDPATKPFVVDTKDLAAKTVGLNTNTIRFDLTHDDLYCLNDGEFLNDNIIDFYLQYIYYEKLSEEDRKRTYLFNSFFFTRLTKRGNDENPKISAAERRYNCVKRWLRDIDIFSKDYLIVPINQTVHWYIVLIQYHNNVPTEGDLISDDEDDSVDNRLRSKKKKLSERIICPTVSNSDSLSPLKSNILSNGVIDEPTSDNDIHFKPNIESLVNRKNHSQTPSIVIFDSLRAGSKIRVTATLREFLQLEYDHKKTLPTGSLARKLFNIDTIPTIDAAVPQQPNSFDCGLYVLQYIESFFAHRSETIDLKSSSTFSDWCEKHSMGSSKRKEILNVINQHIVVKDE